MVQPRRVGSLEVEDDIHFQRRMWTVERIGWGAMALVIAAALLGAAGNGPLSSARAVSGDGSLEAQYERFWRRDHSMPLRLTFQPRPDAEGLSRLWVDSAYLGRIQVEQWVPVPLREELIGDRVQFVFPTREAQSPVHIDLHAKPDQTGKLHARIGVAGGGSIDFSQFIYP